MPGNSFYQPLSAEEQGSLTLTYDLSKGILQMVFGFYSDRLGRTRLISWGMIMCSLALFVWAFVGAAGQQGSVFFGFFLANLLLGVGKEVPFDRSSLALISSCSLGSRPSSLIFLHCCMHLSPKERAWYTLR